MESSGPPVRWQTVCKISLTGIQREPILLRKRVLFVDPDPAWRELAESCAAFAELQVCTTFEAARRELLSSPPDFLVTNLRLGAHNGLHLVHLVVANELPTRCIVHSRYADACLVREAQELGAFVESPYRLPNALPSYAMAIDLPPRDRRSPAEYDRRRFFRGGRRSADVAIVGLSM